MADETNPAPVAEESEENTEQTEDTESTESQETEESGAEAADTAEEGTEKAVEAKKVKEEVKALKKKLKLKVDGKEFEEEFDPSDDDYLTKQLQLAKVSQKRMSEYSQLEKEVKSFIEQLRKNPKKVLADPNIGIDIKMLAKEIIEEEISNSQKSPEQLEKEKLEARLRELEDERKKEKEDFQKQEFQRLQEQAYQQYDTAMSQALEKTDLPKSPYVVNKMADYMLMGLQEGLDVKPEDVIPLVREEIQEDIKQMFAVMPDEVIEQIVGKDVFTRVRKKSLAKAKANPPTPVKSAAKDVGKSSKDEQKDGKKDKQTFKQFFGA